MPEPRPTAAAASAHERLPILDENATIEDYSTYSLLNNPGAHSAYHDWKAALEKIPQAKSLPDPSLSYGYFVSVEDGDRPRQHEFQLMQMFPFFGKLGLREQIEVASAMAAHASYEQEKLNLLNRLKEAYYEYYYLGRAIQITEQNIELLGRLEEVAAAAFRAGGAQQDVLKAQVELEKLKNRLKSQEDMRGATAAKLNAELNRPIDTPVPWPKGVKPQTLQFSEDQILQLARTGNRELKAMSFEVEKSRAMLALARKEFWPDFGLGVGYMLMDGTGSASMMSGDMGDNVSAMVSVNLPIWRKRLHAAVREAQAMLESAVAAKQQKENALLSEVRMMLYKHNNAVRQIGLYANTLIPKARQALDASEAGYRAGKVDFVNLLDGERELLEFSLDYEMALSEHFQRVAELEMLVGQLLTQREPLAEGASMGAAERERSAQKAKSELLYPQNALSIIGK